MMCWFSYAEFCLVPETKSLAGSRVNGIVNKSFHFYTLFDVRVRRMHIERAHHSVSAEIEIDRVEKQ